MKVFYLFWCVCAALVLAACSPQPPSVVAYADLPATGSASAGEALYQQGIGLVPSCASCHDTEGAASPRLAGFSARAGRTVLGQSDREYTFYSITEPWRYLVAGYGNAMPHQYDDSLTPQQIADIIAYLLTL